nr:porin family protein [uncultured Prevotella sp.]
MRKIFLLVLLMAMPVIAVNAQSDRNQYLQEAEKKGWEYDVKFGINIGGSAPIPLPVQIRAIKKYDPRLNALIEGDVIHWLGEQKKWGVSVGLRFEEKGMHTGARVKSYSTEVIDGNQKVSGNYTGNVHTKYSSILMTIPIMANYKINGRWRVRAGIFESCKLDGDFSGYVSDGYLRQGSPVGQKLEFKDGKRGTYDFSHDLRRFQTGLQAGASWFAFNHFSVNADLSWGLNDIFKSDFKTVTFNLYPIYLNLGFGYKF